MSDATIPAAPDGYRTVNPFIITDDASKVIEFIVDVFHGQEMPDAKTFDADGLILHSEIKIGDSMVAVADRKPDWPYTPSLLQVYTDDMEATIKKAVSHGAEVVTKPTDFLGAIFARFKDKQGNLWWVYQHTGDIGWGETSSEGDEDSAEASWEPSEEAIYIHDTLIEAMRGLKK